MDKADSLEVGTITLYGKIRSSINRRCHMLLDEADIIYLYVVMILAVRKSLEKRICRKCGTEFARKLRVCPACGEAYSEADMEKEFSAVIAGENEKETEKSPEEINRDYERIEEMNVEAAFALNESDIDEIIREKQLRDDSD